MTTTTPLKVAELSCRVRLSELVPYVRAKSLLFPPRPRRNRQA